MYDIHTHILPNTDDGSDSVELSLKMLREEAEQGIKGIVLTPHFYADSDTPEGFMARRAKAKKELDSRIHEVGNCPKLILGAEVHFYPGMSRSESLRELTIGSTDHILVEMPFRTWNRNYVREIRDIGNNLNLQVVIAHIDRYLDRDKDLLDELIYDTGALMQVNAEGFTSRRTRRRMQRLLKEGSIHFIGSDCHNMTTRKPDIQDALKQLRKAEKALEQICVRSSALFTEDI
ncbi:MAG: capsular polysaccharide biosynthesis protein [Saccharofermentans sp.]|nr:capsular polysaccharide biosynthesis protein [Saccharofermentans sp.]